MKNIIDLSNKTIFIAGASSGIGEETAILCSQLGARVILLARREDKLKDVCSRLEGKDHKYYSFDLSQRDEIDQIVKQIIAENGAIDGMVYSAGIPGTRPLKMMKPTAFDDIMLINSSAFVELTRCVTKKGHYNEGLSIVGVSSISSSIGSRGKTAYCASKAAMDGAARAMAKELGANGIRVNTVCPGLIETAIYQKFQDNAGDSKDAQMKIDRQYLGLGRTIDVANLVVFLLSEASRLITGSSIGVDGGLLSS